MPSHFCEHGYLRQCPICGHNVDMMANIMGENVPKLGVQSLVPKGRRDKDVKWLVNKETGHREKMYFNWGTGKYYRSVAETERDLNKKGLRADVEAFN